MLTLGTVIVMLSAHAAAAALLDDIPSTLGNPPVNDPSILGTLPVNVRSTLESLPVTLPSVGNLPLPLQPSIPSLKPPIKKRHLSKKQSTDTAGDKCKPVANYCIAKTELMNELNATLPQKIEDMLKCDHADLGGLLGSVLNMVKDAEVLSALGTVTSVLGTVTSSVGSVTSVGSGTSPLDSVSSVTGALPSLSGPLSILGAGNLLGNGNSKNSPKAPVATQVPSGNQDTQGSQSDSDMDSDAKNLVNKLNLQKLPPVLNTVNDVTASADLSKASSLVNDVTDKANGPKGSVGGVLDKAVPPKAKDAIGGMLDVSDLTNNLLAMVIAKVTVEDLNMTTANEEILVKCKATAHLEGEGITSMPINLIGFEVHMDVALTLGISTNNTKCPTFEIQKKDVKANKVDIKLLETVEKIEPLPLPLPLGDTVAQVLTVKMNSQSKDSKSCEVSFSDFGECKNSTGIFTYKVQNIKLSDEALTILFCADAVFNGKTEPVNGSPLPSCPKNANVSMTLSHNMIRTIVSHAAKKTSVSRNGMHVTITQIRYFYLSPNKMEVKCSTNILRDDEMIAQGKTVSILSRDSKILGDKIVTEIKLLSAEHNVTPSEAMNEEVKQTMDDMTKMFTSNLKDILKNANVPAPVLKFSLESQPVIPNHLDLQAMR